MYKFLRWICIAPYHDSPLRRSDMDRSFTCRLHHTCLYL